MVDELPPHDRARVSRIGWRGGTLPCCHPEAGGDHQRQAGGRAERYG